MRRTLLWTVSLLIATPPATAAAAPVISVSPSIRNYGNVNVGSNSSDFLFVVGNNGSDILTVSSAAISGTDASSYSIVSAPTLPINLGPGSTVGFSVRFTPASGGFKTASLTFGSNDPVTPNKSATLNGTGIGPHLAVTPGPLDFGNVHVNTSATLSLSLSNSGGGTLTITSLSIGGADASSFSLVSPPATPINLGNGSSVSLTVRFAPTTVGAKAASLVVASNGSAGPDSSIALAGTPTRPEPVIVAVKDVPNDQGGKMKLSWDASTFDTQPSPIVDHYWVLRSVPPRVALTRIARGDRVHALGAGPLGDPAGRIYTSLATTTIYWELVATVQALHFFDGYSYVVPTVSDSTPTSNPYTLLLVVALNAANTSHWDSAPDSGYSVDNLVPASPAPLTGSYSGGATLLHWHPNTEADLAGYRVYRGSSAGFVPGPASQIGAQADTGFADPGAAGSYYKVSALDIHGNESPFALLSPSGTVGVPESGVTGFALAAPWPNPARVEAELFFALPAAGPASLRIYDAQGRVVRDLVRGERPAGRQSARWNGRDQAGRAVGSGIYFARLSAAGRTIDVRFSLTQ